MEHCPNFFPRGTRDGYEEPRPRISKWSPSQGVNDEKMDLVLYRQGIDNMSRLDVSPNLLMIFLGFKTFNLICVMFCRLSLTHMLLPARLTERSQRWLSTKVI